MENQHYLRLCIKISTSKYYLIGIPQGFHICTQRGIAVCKKILYLHQNNLGNVNFEPTVSQIICLVKQSAPTYSLGQGVAAKASAVGFCLGCGLFGSYNSLSGLICSPSTRACNGDQFG